VVYLFTDGYISDYSVIGLKCIAVYEYMLQNDG